MPIKSPFKFLDAYTAVDDEVYFGREKETEQLYELVNQNRLVLVYGPSGSGKTSLIQCGLFNRLDPTDWLPISVRRKDDLPNDLKQAVAGWARRFNAYQTGDEEDIVPMLERLNQYSLRPIYLIFDQFEELLISGTEEEKAAFVSLIQDIYYKCRVPTHILLVMREEYLGGLFEFEEKIPRLFESRLRVERMSGDTLKRVILESCERFKITLQDPPKNTKHIIKVVSGRNAIYQLPYLQVYMDMLYREDWERTYPDFEGNTLPDPLWPLEFTNQEIEDFGEFENVLGRYLEEQKGYLLKRMAEVQRVWASPEGPTVPLDYKYVLFTESHLNQVLDQLVTPVGTKKIVRFSTQPADDAPLGYYIELQEDAPQSLRAMSPAIRTALIKALETGRLLRLLDEGVLELAHDSLANIIYKSRDEEQQMRNQALHTIDKAQKDFERTGEYMSRKQLNFVEDHLPHLTLEQVQKNFVRDSYNDAECKEQEEADRLQKELDDQKKINKSQRDLNRVILAGLALSILLGVVAYINWKGSQSSQRIAETNLIETKKRTLDLFQEELNGAYEKGNSFVLNTEFQNAASAYKDGAKGLLDLKQWVDSTFEQLSLQIKRLDKGSIDSLHAEANQVIQAHVNMGFDSLRTKAEEKQNLMEQYKDRLAEASTVYDQNEYAKAYRMYRDADLLWKKLAPEEQYSEATNGMDRTQLKLRPQFKERLRLAEKFMNQGGEVGEKYAKVYLREARSITALISPTQKEKEQLEQLEFRLEN